MNKILEETDQIFSSTKKLTNTWKKCIKYHTIVGKKSHIQYQLNIPLQNILRMQMDES